MMGYDLLDLPPSGSTTRNLSQLRSARMTLLPSHQQDEQLEDGDAAKPPGVTADVAARMAAPPRLTRLCEFEDEQLEEEYKSYEASHALEPRVAHIAVTTSLVALAGAVVNWAVGADDVVLPVFTLAYAGCWLRFAVYAHCAASRSVLARATNANAFAALYICTHIPFMLLFGGLREKTTIGHSAIPTYQLFIASLAAAYAQLDVRHCAVIACAGTLGVALNSALMPVQLLSSSELGRFQIVERIYGVMFLALLEAVMVFVSVCINTAMRIAYHFYRAVDADASERELATAERERMLQHEAEVELKLRIAEATKAARSRLIRMAMHDLRSPLLSVANAVAIVLDLMPETRVDDSVVVECLRAMATCSQLMQHIVSDMLDFERIDSGEFKLAPTAPHSAA